MLELAAGAVIALAITTGWLIVLAIFTEDDSELILILGDASVKAIQKASQLGLTTWEDELTGQRAPLSSETSPEN